MRAAHAFAVPIVAATASGRVLATGACRDSLRRLRPITLRTRREPLSAPMAAAPPASGARPPKFETFEGLLGTE